MSLKNFAIIIPLIFSCYNNQGQYQKENSQKYNIIELTDNNFQKEVYESKIPVMVDFWAPWCGPCLMASPTIEKMAEEYKGKLKVGRLNVDDEEMTAFDEYITRLPTLKFYKDSNAVSEFIGLTRNYEDSLKSRIEEVLKQ